MKKIQNVDLLSFLGDLRKYFKIFLSCFDSFWASKSLPGIENGYFYCYLTQGLKKTQNVDIRVDRFKVICVYILKSLFVLFWWFLGFKITAWHWKWLSWPLSNVKIEEIPKCLISPWGQSWGKIVPHGEVAFSNSDINKKNVR